MSTQDLGQYIEAVRQNGIRLNANEPLVVASSATFSGAVTFSGSVSLGAETITSTSANAFTVGPAGTTNPTLNVDSSTASAATGLNVKSAAAASGLALSVLSSGTDESLKLDAKGAGTVTINSVATGAISLARATSVTGAVTVTSAGSSALAVGANGATTPALQVDASTASQVAGLKLTGAATGGTVALAAVDSGSNTNLSMNGKGSGTLLLGNTSTGQVSIGRGSVKPPVTSSTTASLGTAQNTTPTAAQLVGGVITQTSATGAGTCTLDNGTNISTAVPGVAVGDTFQCVYANLGGAQTVTITGATGSTVIGSAAVASGKNALMLFVNTGTNTWNVYVNLSA